MAIQFKVVDPRVDILARFDDEIRQANLATSKKVKEAHRNRAEAYRVSLELIDCYFRSCAPIPASDPEYVVNRTLDEIRDEAIGRGIFRG